MTTQFNEKKFEEIKEEIKSNLDEKHEIDMEELTTAEYDSNIYGVDPQYAVGGYDYDEDEYYAKQCEKAIEYIEADGLYEYVDCITEEEEPIYQQKIIDWLLNEIAETGF